MSYEHPDQGEDQNPDTERPVADAAPTGDTRVDNAAAGLGRLQGRPVDEHVAILEEVHGQLRDILGELEETPESPQEPGQP